MAGPMFIQVGSLRPAEDGWMVTEPFVFYSQILGRNIEVPVGFFTDLASVPQIVPRFIVDVANGRNRRAAVVHDPLCKTEFKKKYGISQAVADLIFREALAVCGVPLWRANTMYLAVMFYQLYTHKTQYWSVPE